jgi:hypothetical protein
LNIYIYIYIYIYIEREREREREGDRDYTTCEIIKKKKKGFSAECKKLRKREMDFELLQMKCRSFVWLSNNRGLDYIEKEYMHCKFVEEKCNVVQIKFSGVMLGTNFLFS